MTTLFEEALRAAQARGEVRAEADPVRLGRYFANAHIGLRAMAKVVTDEAYLNDIIEATLSILEPPA